MPSDSFNSPGVSTQEIDLTFSQTGNEPEGVPACVVGTSVSGPAFVPITVATGQDFSAAFGSSEGKHLGVIAGQEWLKNQKSLTYLRVLGVGDGKKRNESGTVTSAGFVVGEKLPTGSAGILGDNNFSSLSSTVQEDGDSFNGRTYFLGCLMSQSSDSDIFSDSGIQTGDSAVPIVRGVVMTPRGVLLNLFSTASITASMPNTYFGDVVLQRDGNQLEEFILILSGHIGSTTHPAVLTASFDLNADNYFTKVLNTDPTKLYDAGHYLYTHWDVHPNLAVVTGSGVLDSLLTTSSVSVTREVAGFVLPTSLETRNTGSVSVPNFESFENRYTHAKSPFVVSQNFGGQRFNLFRVHSLHDGAGQAEKIKISIDNIIKSDNPNNKFCSFNLLVRDINDSDLLQIVLERFTSINLDPSSDRFIAKVIGDTDIFFDFDRNVQSQKLVFDGNYKNNSSLIRIEPSEQLINGEVPAEALPVGFRGIYHLQTSGSSVIHTGSLNELSGAGNFIDTLDETKKLFSSLVTPPIQMRKNIAKGIGPNKSVESGLYWGIQFEHIDSLTETNKSNVKNKSVLNFMKYFPDFSESEIPNCWVGDNEGTLDSPTLGVLDADKFQNNLFTLENIHVLTTSINTVESKEWDEAEYHKDSSVTVANKRKITATDFTDSNREFLKYTFILQGGFDGVNIFNEAESKINSLALEQDMLNVGRGKLSGPNVVPYTKALDILSNTSEVDFKLFAMPGIRNSVITDQAIDMVETRFDAMYLMDIEQYDNNGDQIIDESLNTNVSVTNTVDQFKLRNLDSSFAAAYFPDVLIIDTDTLSEVQTPPTVAVLGSFGLNDKIGQPWFAPAGYSRGVLPSTLETKVVLSSTNIDKLYQADINPLVSYPGTSVVGLNPGGGVVVWGQKTLLKNQSSLDRINVRRLLIEIRRSVREIANTFIFEPSRAETLTRFSSVVQPRLENIKKLGGLNSFKVVIDTTTTTQADIEANTLRGKILIQPVKSVEFVSVDFVLTNNNI